MTDSRKRARPFVGSPLPGHYTPYTANVSPRILLDFAARRELARLVSGRRRPHNIAAPTWHLLSLGAIASLELYTLEALSNLLGSNLCEHLRQASEAGSREVVG